MKHIKLFLGIVLGLLVLFFSVALTRMSDTLDAVIAPQVTEETGDVVVQQNTFILEFEDQQVGVLTYAGAGNEAALLELPVGRYELSQVEAASGAKYESGDGNVVYWEHGGEATLTIGSSTLKTIEIVAFADAEEGLQLRAQLTQDMNNDVQNTISFDAESGQWKDNYGVCNTCTPENGFGAEGHILGFAPGLISITVPSIEATVSSPIELRGKAVGAWFFEASAPVVVVDWDGKVIGEGYITAEGDWMTENYVPFTGTVSYDLPADTPYNHGTVIFRKDNPSGLPENDMAVEVPVTFE